MSVNLSALGLGLTGDRSTTIFNVETALRMALAMRITVLDEWNTVEKDANTSVRALTLMKTRAHLLLLHPSRQSLSLLPL